MKKISGINELEIIESLKRKVKNRNSVIKGIGDDAAVIKYQKGKYMLFTTDMIVEGVHFRVGSANYYQIGRKGLAVNISDIAAMGGLPKYALISLGLPRTLSRKAVDEIISGIVSLAKEYNIDIVGGDTVRSKAVTINIALVGEVKKKHLVLRNTAKEQDLIFVTGSLGNTRTYKQFNFIPRVQEAQGLIAKFKPTAMIDISDGLALDLKRIADSSYVRYYERSFQLWLRSGKTY